MDNQIQEHQTPVPPLQDHVAEVKHWLESIVIGWNLCPFARKEFMEGRVRFALSQAEDEETLLRELIAEFDLLDRLDQIETTILIHPSVLTDFHDYNQFLDYAEGLIQQLELEGVYQIASFHPNYQFAGTEIDDQENYTNRSPYPLLHILREKSLSEAIDRYPDTESIPERNMELLRNMLPDKLREAFSWRFKTSSDGSLEN